MNRKLTPLAAVVLAAPLAALAFSTPAAIGTWNLATGAMAFDPGQAIALAAAGFEEGGLSTFGISTWTVRGTSGPDIIRVGNGDGGPGTDRSLSMGVGDDTCNSVEVFDFDDCEHVVP